MKKIIGVLLLTAALGGCARLQTDWNKLGTVYSAITGSTVSPQAVIVASNVFDGVERTATSYLLLPKCTGATQICRDPVATKAIIKAVRAGRVARGNLQQFMKDHPNQLGPSGLYDALEASIGTLQSIFAQYQVSK